MTGYQQLSSVTCPVLIGRARELRAVQEQLSPAGHRVLVVSGEAGVGKSRLIAEGASAGDAVAVQGEGGAHRDFRRDP